MKNIAIILAAGQGKRLKPFTNVLPKCLLKVANLPILHHQLRALKKNDITDINIVVGFEADKIITYTKKKFPSLKVNFIYNERFDTANNLYSFALASEKITAQHAVFQLNSDVIFDAKIIQKLKQTDSRSYIGVRLGKCSQEEIKVSLTKTGTIGLLNKQIAPKKSIGEGIGINKFSPPFWSALKINLKKLKKISAQEYFEYAIEKTIASGNHIYPFSIGKLKAIEIDFPKDLKEARKIMTR